MKYLNKGAIISQIVEHTGMTKKDATDGLEAFTSIVMDALAKKEGVRLVGFGTFTDHHRKARKGRNPQTGKSLQIAAREVPSFKAGKTFKRAVNK